MNTPLDARTLRDAFGAFLTGVTVVTTSDRNGTPPTNDTHFVTIFFGLPCQNRQQLSGFQHGHAFCREYSGGKPKKHIQHLCPPVA